MIYNKLFVFNIFKNKNRKFLKEVPYAKSKLDYKKSLNKKNYTFMSNDLLIKIIQFLTMQKVFNKSIFIFIT